MNAYIRDYDNQPVNSIKIYSADMFKNQINQNDFKLFHTNIRSLAKNIDDLIVLLDNLSVEFDLIILTETRKLYDHTIFKIQGYDSIYNQGSLNKNDGVLVYVKSSLNYTTKIEWLGEIKVVTVTVIDKNKKIEIDAIYRSPNSDPKIFNQNLITFLNDRKRNLTRVITGDININLLNNNNEVVDEYKNIMSAFGYISYINEYTRLPSQTCLDHFFINDPHSSNCKSYIFKYNITDHCPIALTFERKRENTQSSKYNYKYYIDYKTLRNNLASEKWEMLYKEKKYRYGSK